MSQYLVRRQYPSRPVRIIMGPSFCPLHLLCFGAAPVPSNPAARHTPNTDMSSLQTMHQVLQHPHAPRARVRTLRVRILPFVSCRWAGFDASAVESIGGRRRSRRRWCRLVCRPRRRCWRGRSRRTVQLERHGQAGCILLGYRRYARTGR
jgi:hypothetical protein